MPRTVRWPEPNGRQPVNAFHGTVALSTPSSATTRADDCAHLQGGTHGGVPRPICIALVDDYDIVLVGLAHLFDEYRDRIMVAEIDANQPVIDDVEIVLYDSFAQPEADHDEIEILISNPRAHKVVVYTWNFHPHLVDSAIRKGASGYLSKVLPAGKLVTALEAIHAGEVVISDQPPRSRLHPALDWPGRVEGLTNRESEVLALITQGKSNAEIAQAMYLSINTIKSYIRSAYRRIGVTNRTHAALWGTEHGFRPDHHRIDHWRGGP
jgi:DNA-binding NarL/FixJ family response regulator